MAEEKQSQKFQVYQYLKHDADVEGATAEEISEALGIYKPSVLCALSELRKQGIAESAQNPNGSGTKVYYLMKEMSEKKDEEVSTEPEPDETEDEEMANDKTDNLEEVEEESEIELKEDTFSLDEGNVFIQYPAYMSAGSFDDFTDFIKLIHKKVSRSVEEGDTCKLIKEFQLIEKVDTADKVSADNEIPSLG